MGFNSVYKSLLEVFPAVDYRLLKAVAIEHSKDADLAVEFILTEVLPFLPNRSEAPSSSIKAQEFKPFNEVRDNSWEKNSLSRNQSKGQSSARKSELVADDPDEDNPMRHQLVVEEAGPSSCPGSATAERATVDDHTDSVNLGDATSLDEDSDTSSVSNFFDANDSNDKTRVDILFEETKGLHNCQENSSETAYNQHSGSPSVALASESALPIKQHSADIPECSFQLESGSSQIPHELIATSVQEIGITGSINYDSLADLEHSNEVVTNDCDVASNDRSHFQYLSMNDEKVKLENGVGELISSAVDENLPESTESVGLTVDPENIQLCEITGTSPEKDISVSELGDGAALTGSGQICRIDLLKDVTEDAKNNKKILFSAMESVISLMKEVELQENAAEQARYEASRGGIDFLASVEEMKEMLHRAKEANDMHAGEVYGEKAILATEVRELQARILNLMDERDKSLRILDEMRQTLESRLAAAEEERKAAEQEKLEKENVAREALAEQELIVEKVVRESKMLQKEAEENSKLRDFLVDRGHVVDVLQGEISVICQDVRLLKEKFDERVPLSKSVSSSQTSCILASLSSSLRSSVSDRVASQDVSHENQHNRSRSPSADSQHNESQSPSNDGQHNRSRSPANDGQHRRSQSPSIESHHNRSRSPSIDSLTLRSILGDIKTRDEHKALSDDGWDVFDKDAELYS